MQTYDKTNGSTVYKIEAEDTKKLSKVNTVSSPPLEIIFPLIDCCVV